MQNVISCRELAALMASDRLFAVFDVRERGEYNGEQIAGATSLPRSQIEFRIGDLVPNQKIPIVLYDDDGRRARLAAQTLSDIGYVNVALLAGGLSEWREWGAPTVSGVNVPSKAFGERVHHQRGVPDITAQELKRLQENRAELIILDVRTPEEYRRSCIPGGINVPGGDLILWTETLRRRPSAHIVINCAGRTRSIIGAAALQRLGLRNVRALRNGTMGWLLAGFALEEKPERGVPPAASERLEEARELGRRIIREERITEISAAKIDRLVRDGGDSAVYCIDVRSEREYENGHLRGSLNVPGGQAVQRADDFIAVRNATIVFISDEAARAAMAAYWYRHMGFPNVAVLQDGLRAWTASRRHLEHGDSSGEPLGYESARASVRFVAPDQLHAQLNASTILVLDVGSSAEFANAHVPSSQWVSRGWLEAVVPERFPDARLPIVLTCPDERQSVFAARALAALEYPHIAVLAGGKRAWKEAGLPMEQGLEYCLVEPNDIVLSPSIGGNQEEMQRYLEWELKLRRS